MIIYNVTINIENDVQDTWVTWMKETHIPQVMATGFFTTFSFNKLLSRQEDETGTTKRLFEGKFVAFRTLMEKV